MATTKNENNEVTAKKDDGRVDLFIPRGGSNEEPNLMIGFNGKNYLLPRGKTSRVPKYVAEEYYRSQRAQERYDDTMDRLLKQKENPTNLD